MRLRATKRDRSQIIIEILRTGSLDELCDQLREEIRTSADLGESLRKGVARKALTAGRFQAIKPVGVEQRHVTRRECCDGCAYPHRWVDADQRAERRQCLDDALAPPNEKRRMAGPGER